jgi:hypothetical protein
VHGLDKPGVFTTVSIFGLDRGVGHGVEITAQTIDDSPLRVSRIHLSAGQELLAAGGHRGKHPLQFLATKFLSTK